MKDAGLIKKIYNTVRNIIKLSQLISTDDTGDLQTGMVRVFNTDYKTVLITPYGLASNPPDDSLILNFDLQGQESNKIGLASSSIDRVRNLAKGEVAIVNQVTGSIIRFMENGDISIVSQGNVVIEGDTDITGETDLTGNVTVTGGTVTLATTVVMDTHVHPYTDDGNPAVTGPPQGP